jgi:CheY-like chemotaxis protein
MIIKSSEDGAMAVRRIQEFAQPKPQKELIALDVTAIVNDVIDATAPRWRDQAQRQGRSITVGASTTGPAYVNGDPSELREALSNLVLNAVDAIPTHGSIDVTVDATDDLVVLKVRDSGIGMTEEVLRQAFDPFFTTKPVGSGVGLGLALTHGIVERHGGKISAMSRPGAGTTLQIELARVPAPRPTETPPTQPLPLSLRVLVVDDEPDLAEQLEMILAIGGHKTRVCHGGAEALAVLASDTFDLVITDLGMPDIGGWDVAREARLRHPKIQIALLTGWATELIGTDELHERGLDFVITKPYRMQAIQDLIANVSKAIV